MSEDNQSSESGWQPQKSASFRNNSTAALVTILIIISLGIGFLLSFL